MAGTTLVAAQIALIAGIDALSGLDGVSVSYSYVAKLADGGNREYIYGGAKADADVEPSAMKGSARIKRSERVTWPLHIGVIKPGEITTQAGNTRVVAIGAEVENYLAANPTLAGAVTGLIFVHIVDWTLTSYTDEKQSYSELDYTLAFDSYLT